MAAPETKQLLRMRQTLLVLCVMCAFGVLGISQLVAFFGRGASFVVGTLLLFTALHTALYVFRKNKADNAYLDAAVSEQESA